MSDDSDGTDGSDEPDGADGPDRTDGRSDGRPRPDDKAPADADRGSPVDGSAGGDGDVETDVRDLDDLLSEFDEPDGDLEDLFDEVPSANLDAGAVWAELEGSTTAIDATASDDAEHVEDPLDDAVLGEGPGDEAIVSKGSYCQRCEHFSSPPDVGCGNPGTEIVELADVKHFRVRNCPVVARRQGATVSSLDGDGAGSGDGTGGTAGGDTTGDDDTPGRSRDAVDPNEDGQRGSRGADDDGNDVADLDRGDR